MAVARFFRRHAKFRNEKTRLAIWSSIYGLLTENIDVSHRREAINICKPMDIRTCSVVDSRTSSGKPQRGSRWVVQQLEL